MADRSAPEELCASQGKHGVPIRTPGGRVQGWMAKRKATDVLDLVRGKIALAEAAHMFWTDRGGGRTMEGKHSRPGHGGPAKTSPGLRRLMNGREAASLSSQRLSLH